MVQAFLYGALIVFIWSNVIVRYSHALLYGSSLYIVVGFHWECVNKCHPVSNIHLLVLVHCRYFIVYYAILLKQQDHDKWPYFGHWKILSNYRFIWLYCFFFFSRISFVTCVVFFSAHHIFIYKIKMNSYFESELSESLFLSEEKIELCCV